MDYAGLTSARAVSDALAAIGLHTSPQHVHRLMRGTEGRHTNPTLVLIAGLAQVCNVPAQWFFGADESLPLMIDRYGEVASRSGQTSRAGGEYPATQAN